MESLHSQSISNVGIKKTFHTNLAFLILVTVSYGYKVGSGMLISISVMVVHAEPSGKEESLAPFILTATVLYNGIENPGALHHFQQSRLSILASRVLMDRINQLFKVVVRRRVGT